VAAGAFAQGVGKYFIAWFPMIVIAIANGTIREAWYKPKVGDLRAHQVSTVSLIVLFAMYVWAIGRVWKIESAGQAWVIGLIWLAMTVAFEFGFGHLIAGHSWRELLHDYNLAAGRIWSLVLIAILLAPYVSFRLRMGW
jgi:hypothetical protein